MFLFSTNFRNVGPLCFGFLVGSLISLAVFPSLQKFSADLCLSNKDVDLADQNNKDDNGASVTDGGLDNYDPVIHTQITPKSNSAKKSKLVRPRFFATELGVKDKLFVSVIIRKENVSFAVALNKTIAHHVNRLLFFSHADVNLRNSGANNSNVNQLFLIAWPTSLTDDTSKFYFVINYVAQHFLNNYDWFYFVTDSTYVKAFKLYEFATHLSSGFDVILGKKRKQQNFCSPDAGLLISHGGLKKIAAVLQKCSTDLTHFHAEAGASFHECIENYADLKCNEEWNGKVYKSLDLPVDIDWDDELSHKIGVRDSFHQVLTVSDVRNSADVYRLHKYFCYLELEQLNQLTTNIEEGILNSTLAADERISWPAGLHRMMRPKNRYETFQWDFFTPTEIFETSNDKNVRSLDGINKKDYENVMEFVLRKFKSKEPELEFVQLISGYRKFDPARGVDYILDLKFRNCTTSDVEKLIITKRIRLIRALSKAEIVPVPYVTEAARITIVVPVFPYDVETARSFLANYARTCLETEENSRLAVVLLYSTIEEQSEFRGVVRDFEILKRKYAKSSNDYYYHVRSTSGVGVFDAVDFVVRQLGVDVLYFVATPRVELRADFLNRIRMNTIINFQVFFPIPFVRYHPKIVGSSADRSDVNKVAGRFDRHDYSVASFYGVDYVAMRRRTGVELIELFVDSNLHIIRVADPALILAYDNKICHPRLSEEAYADCLLSKKEGLASKSQLAALILDRGLL